MKIAMMVRGFIPAPRPADMVYVIIDIALTIAEGLAKRGHKVDFYGPRLTNVPAPIRARTKNLRPLVRDAQDMRELEGSTDLLTFYMPALWDQYLSIDMFKRAAKGEYDILNFHHPESSISLAQFFPKVPVVYTMHDSLDKWHPEIFKLFRSKNQHCISISNNQRKDAPDLPYLSTVYNGVDTDLFTFSGEHDGYMLYVGRIIPEKGLREAVQVAHQSGERLLIIGNVPASQQSYFERYVRPYLSERIIYLGQKPHEEIVQYFQKAKCLLMPSQWEEPFGVTMIEAMSCGTPVVALRRGAAPEVIDDGHTGFIVDSVDHMIAAVKRVTALERHACRQHVLDNFSFERMIDGYEAGFQSVAKPVSAHRAIKRVPKAIKGKLYNTVYESQTLLRLPGRTGHLPDIPPQL